MAAGGFLTLHLLAHPLLTIDLNVWAIFTNCRLLLLLLLLLLTTCLMTKVLVVKLVT